MFPFMIDYIKGMHGKKKLTIYHIDILNSRIHIIDFFFAITVVTS